MSLEGRIIEFLDAEQLRIAYVRKQERDRLHLIDPRGRNLSVGGDRVVIVHRAVDEGEFPRANRKSTSNCSGSPWAEAGAISNAQNWRNCSLPKPVRMRRPRFSGL